MFSVQLVIHLFVELFFLLFHLVQMSIQLLNGQWSVNSRVFCVYLLLKTTLDWSFSDTRVRYDPSHLLRLSSPNDIFRTKVELYVPWLNSCLTSHAVSDALNPIFTWKKKRQSQLEFTFLPSLLSHPKLNKNEQWKQNHLRKQSISRTKFFVQTDILIELVKYKLKPK